MWEENASICSLESGPSSSSAYTITITAFLKAALPARGRLASEKTPPKERKDRCTVLLISDSIRRRQLQRQEGSGTLRRGADQQKATTPFLKNRHDAGKE